MTHLGLQSVLMVILSHLLLNVVKSQSITAYLANNPSLSFFWTELIDPVPNLKLFLDEGFFTVFAPTNEAFNQLPSDEINRIRNDADYRESVAKMHLVLEDLTRDKLEDRANNGVSINTFNNLQLSVELDGTTLFIIDSNGMLYLYINIVVCFL